MKGIYQIIFILFLVTVSGLSVSGDQSTEIKINGEKASLKSGDILAKADYQVFDIKGGEGAYTLSNTWSFFGLNQGQEYSLRTWHLEANCGCWKQVCGVNCATGEECLTYLQGEEPLMCLPWTTRKGFCASLIPISASQNYTSYHLNYISTIALTSYGGPKYKIKENDKETDYMPAVTPGFTIRTQLESQKYAYNAFIVDKTARKQVALSQYRYAESEGRVITVQEFSALDAKPNMTVNFKDANCSKDGTAQIPASITKESINLIDKNNFRAYSILRKATVAKLQNLFYQDILSHNGVQEWNGTDTFDFLDPCNQLFLTLKRDKNGNYIVIVPPSQRLISGNIICVAINDNPATQYDLVLYELKNETSTWTQSDRFVGLLSRDYLDTLQVRVTTAFEPVLAPSFPSINVEITTELDPPVLKLTSNDTIRCQVYLSSKCTFDIETSGALYATKQIQDCGSWYETGGYNCEGVLGIFFPPAKYVKAPIYGWTENTAMQSLTLGALRASNPPDNKNPGSWGLSWLMEWNRSNWFDKIVTIVLYLGVLALLTFIGYEIYKWMKKNKGKHQPYAELTQRDPEHLAKIPAARSKGQVQSMEKSALENVREKFRRR